MGAVVNVLAWMLSVAGALFSVWLSLWIVFYPGSATAPFEAMMLIAGLALIGASPGALIGLFVGSRNQKLFRIAMIFGAGGFYVGGLLYSGLEGGSAFGRFLFVVSVPVGVAFGRAIVGAPSRKENERKRPLRRRVEGP